MKYLCLALLVAGFLPATASAVDLRNVRPCYGLLGATRTDTKLLPGDVIIMTYDIENLVIDKTGKASYDAILELLDDKGKVLFNKKTGQEVVPALGGTRMPGDLHLIMGTKQAPGNYTLRLTVHDKNDKNADNNAKRFNYKFAVLPTTFGMVGVMAPAIGFPGQTYHIDYNLVNLGLDAKKNPDTEVNIRILENGKAVPGTTTLKMVFPRDLPENVDLKEANIVPLTYPIYLNRAGSYTIEIQAHDKISNTKSEVRCPLTVIDLNKVTGN
jgi:hypothetical protein